jgi:zinc transport system substrate-binding protein
MLRRERDRGMKSKALILVLGLTLLCTLSCQGEREKKGRGDKLVVVTTLFPLYDFARNVGQEKADVTLLLPPGVEPHSFEPKPMDIVRIHEADIFIFTGGLMEPWAETVLKGVDRKKVLVVDASKSITLLPEKEGGSASHQGEGKEAMDPHIWLDLGNAQKMVDAITEGFIARDTKNKSFYEANGEAYKKKLQALDEKFRETLSTCETRIFVHGGHFAFSYLAVRYSLKYVSVYGFSPDAEPTPRHVTEIVNLLRRNRLNYIYYEELINPRMAETVGRETGAKLLPLKGAHNVSREEMEKGITFIDVMEEDLQSLKKGLGCREK